jgi:hypothetical protein
MAWLDMLRRLTRPPWALAIEREVDAEEVEREVA